MSKIELKDITLDYTDQGNVYLALDGVTFSVEEGEFGEPHWFQRMQEKVSH